MIILIKEEGNMAFCVKCGAQLDDNVRFCTACGADQTPDASQTSQQTPPPQQEQPGVQQKAEETWKKFTDTEDTSAQYDKKDIEDNKVMAFLSYLGLYLFLLHQTLNMHVFMQIRGLCLQLPK